MKRVSLVAAIAAAALTLAGCSSAQPGSPEGVVQSTGAATESTAPGDSPSSEGSSEPVGDDASSDAGSTSGGDAAPVSLDGQSTAWFSEFCAISTPFNSFFSAMMTSAMLGASGEPVETSKLVDARTAVATAFEDLGNEMVSVGAKLSNMPPPTVANGEALAQQVITGMSAGGPALGEIAEKVSQVSTADAETFNTELNAVMDSMGDIQGELGIGDLKVDDSVKAAVAELPACKGSLLFSDGF